MRQMKLDTCEILADTLCDGRKRALLSCPSLQGVAEGFHTVETDSLPVAGQEPFVHDDLLRPKKD